MAGLFVNLETALSCGTLITLLLLILLAEHCHGLLVEPVPGDPLHEADSHLNYPISNNSGSIIIHFETFISWRWSRNAQWNTLTEIMVNLHKLKRNKLRENTRENIRVYIRKITSKHENANQNKNNIGICSLPQTGCPPGRPRPWQRWRSSRSLELEMKEAPPL